MEDSTNSQSDELHPEVQAFTTPPRRQGARAAGNGTRARDAANPYTLNPSHPAASSTRSQSTLRRRRHVSTGSIPAEQDPFVNQSHASGARDESRAAADADAEDVESASAADIQQLPERRTQTSPDQRRTQSQPVLEQHGPATTDTPAPISEQSISRQATSSKSPRTPTRRRATTTTTTTTPRKPLSPAQIDARITDVLQKPLTRTQLTNNISTSGQDVGNNYVFSVVPRRRQASIISIDPPPPQHTIPSPSPSPPPSTSPTPAPAPAPAPAHAQEKRIIKIGVTRGSEQVRLRRIQSTCRHALVEQQDDPEHEPISLYFKAEKLIHAELHNFTYEFDCHCERSHGEYFDVDAATAREVVRRWRSFCKHEPYSWSDGSLRPFWAERLRSWRRRRWEGWREEDDDDEEEEEEGEGGGEGEGESGRDADTEELKKQRRWRRQRWHMRHWDRFANPTRLEFLWYDITASLAELWRWRWQAIALLEGFAVAVLAFPSFTALLWFGVVVLLIFAETIRLEAPVTIPAVWRTVEGLVKDCL